MLRFLTHTFQNVRGSIGLPYRLMHRIVRGSTLIGCTCFSNFTSEGGACQ